MSHTPKQSQIADAEPAAAEVDVEVPESPDVFFGGMDDDCMQTPFTPEAPKQQQQQLADSCQQLNLAATAAYPIASQLQLDSQQPVQRMQRGVHASRSTHRVTDTGGHAAGAERLPAAHAASPVTSAALTGTRSSVDHSSDDADGVTDHNSDADWSPEQQKQQQQKQHKGSARRTKQHTPVKTPNRSPFPQIQHDSEQHKHLTSPTKNKTIAQCFAAMAAASPARQKKAGGVVTLTGAAAAAQQTASQTIQQAAVQDKVPAAAAEDAAAAVCNTVKQECECKFESKLASPAEAAAEDDDADSDVVIVSSDENADSDQDSDVQCVREIASQQQQEQHDAPLTQQQLPSATQQRQHQQLPASFSQGLGCCKPQCRNLSISKIREDAAVAKAAKHSGTPAENQPQSTAMQHTQVASAAAVAPLPVESGSTGSLQRKRSAAAAAGPPGASLPGLAADADAACSPNVSSGTPAGDAHLHTPAKVTGKTAVSQQQTLAGSHGCSTAQYQRHASKCIAQVVDSVMRQHPDPSVRAASSGSSRKRQRRASWEQLQRAFEVQVAATGGAVVVAASAGGGWHADQAAVAGAAGKTRQLGTAAPASHDHPVCVAAEATATAAKLLAAGKTAAAVTASNPAEPAVKSAPGAALGDAVELEAAVAVVAAATQPEVPSSLFAAAAETGVAQRLLRRRGRKNVAGKRLSKATGTTAASATGSSSATAPGAALAADTTVERSRASVDPVTWNASAPTAAAATAEAAASGLFAAGGVVDRQLVLDHVKLLDSSHLKSWPAVGARSKDIMPQFNFTPAAREYLMSLVNFRPQAPAQLQTPPRTVSRSRVGKQRGCRSRVTAGSSPATGTAAAAPGAEDGDEVPVPFPEVLDVERGVYHSWKQVPCRKVVFMEFLVDGLAFHMFKPEYEAIFNSAEQRQLLASNILVGQGDGCHPCNYNPLEPLLSQEQQLTHIQDYYKAQQQQCSCSCQQGHPQQDPQHSLGRLLLAGRDLNAWQLLGMYIPGESGFILSSEDDERTNADLTFEAAVYPYHMTFDFHQPKEYADDSSKVAVMTEADPDQCIMALINDSTDWTEGMEQLGRLCPSRAGLVTDACACHKYKGRSDNATTVQCLYKSDDGTPVPVALFATTRPVLAHEELLWSYGRDDTEQPSTYFATQRTNRAQRTCLQLEAVMRQVCCQWLLEDQQHLHALTLEAACTAAASAAAPTLAYAQQCTNSLKARLAVLEYVGSKLANLRSACFVQQLLGPTLEPNAQVAAAETTAGPSSSVQQQRAPKRHKTRQVLQEQEQQQTRERQLAERQALEVDPVSALEAALATEQLAGRPLPAHLRCMLVKLQQQVQNEQAQQQAMSDRIQKLDQVLQQLQQQESSRQADAGSPSLLATRANSYQQLHEGGKGSQGQQQRHAAVARPVASGPHALAAAGDVETRRVGETTAATSLVEAGVSMPSAVVPSCAAVGAVVAMQLAAKTSQCSALQQQCLAKDAEIASLQATETALLALVDTLQQQVAEQSGPRS